MDRAGRTLRSGEDLVEAGLIAPAEAVLAERIGAVYPVAVTPHLARLIDPNDPNDPIARQFLPAAEETLVGDEERDDPIGDAAYSPLKGIVHRYKDRVLLKPLLTCPAYCRFCFRRGAVGEGVLSDEDTAAALDYIRARPELFEVILSGGDPLMLTAGRLGALVRDLSAIEHVRALRVHTRVPISDPARVTRRLVRALDTAKAMTVVLHANHPRELDEACHAACRAIQRAGIPMLAQTVLLKGVNDRPEILEALMRDLVAARIKPYALHHPDLAKGTAHFRPTLDEGQALIDHLRRTVSGLAQPVYLVDIPGGFGKVGVARSQRSETAQGTVLRDAEGRAHPYP